MKNAVNSIMGLVALLLFIPLAGVVVLLIIYYYLKPRPNKTFPTYGV